MAGEGLIVSLVLQRLRLSVDLSAPPGVTALWGPSGCGKSTTLDLIAGHLRPDSGRITLDGRCLFDSEAGVDLPPRARGIGYVLQGDALFPHLSVAENIAYGLWDRPRPERRDRVLKMAEACVVPRPLLDRRPGQLSFGERQRVALARALARAPSLLLLDEPVSALDGPSRGELLHLLRSVVGALDLPVLYVTHNEDEMRILTGRVARYVRGEDGTACR